MSATIAVLAKAPIPGRVKTRLCPPLIPQQAAALATAALSDTLAAVAAAPCERRVLVLDGEPGSWLVPGFDVVPQSVGDLGARLAGAFGALGGPTLVVGMDTPQLDPSMLEHALATLDRDDTDAVLGPAFDGGYWAIGLTTPHRRAFDRVPMSTDATGRRQLAQLHAIGLRVQLLPTMRDVDEYADAQAVASIAPRTAFATELARIRVPDIAIAS